MLYKHSVTSMNQAIQVNKSMSSSNTKTASAASKKPAASKTTKKAPAASTSSSPKSTPAASSSETEPKQKAPRKKVEKKPAASPAQAASVSEVEQEGGRSADAETVEQTETTTTAESSTESTDSTNVPAAVSIDKQIDDLIARKEEDRQRLRREITELRNMKRDYLRQMRDLKKNKKRRDVTRNNGAPRNPSGFAQSSRIRDELCDFLGLDHGSSIARTDVTRRVIEYIKANNLEKSGNRRNIEPDEALEKIVGGPDERRRTMEQQKLTRPNAVVTDELSYFNLQVHLNKHFISQAEEKRQAAAEAENAAVATA